MDLTCLNPGVGSKHVSFILTLYSMIMPFDAFEILCIWKYYGIWRNGSIGATALLSIFFFKVFRTLLKIVLQLFQRCLKIENAVMI